MEELDVFPVRVRETFPSLSWICRRAGPSLSWICRRAGPSLSWICRRAGPSLELRDAWTAGVGCVQEGDWGHIFCRALLDHAR